MIVQLFAVFDAAAKRFTEPWPAPSVEVAIRRFRHTVNEGQNDISMFPEDYSLFHVGEFDQELGRLIAFETPHSLGVAITFRDRPVPMPGNQLSLLKEGTDA